MRTAASLPMYPQPGARAAWERLWRHVGARLRARGLPAPRRLSWPADLPRCWAAPDLFLSQTCARPFVSHLHETATVLGAFDFGLPGCPPGFYCSYLMARADDPRDLAALLASGRVAVNGTDSQSGYGVFEQFGGLPAAPLVTGAHARSVRAVAEGRADLAAIDAMSWRMILRGGGPRPRLAIRATSRPTPAPPVITARRHLAPALRAALAEGFATAPAGPKRWLGLSRFVAAADADYLGFALEPFAPGTQTA